MNLFENTYLGNSQSVIGKRFAWSCPSNIALVKYWGKLDIQLPANANISFTLDECRTETEIACFEKNSSDQFEIEFFLDGNRNEKFEKKILTFFDRIIQYCPFVGQLKLVMNSSNSFPHSSGIASSASGFGALALCLITIEQEIGTTLSELELQKKASFLARLGSGSACRSIYGGVVQWGQHNSFPCSSNLFAQPMENVHSVFETYRDSVLIVEKGEKQVSSSVGHNLMNGHPYASSRFQQAEFNLNSIKQILKNGDLSEFTRIVESEALALHAMMTTSSPYYLLIKPNTVNIIQTVWEFRKETDSNVCITLDAGANVHLLYPEADEKKVNDLINNQLVEFCQDGHYICDRVGNGPSSITQLQHEL